MIKRLSGFAVLAILWQVGVTIFHSPMFPSLDAILKSLFRMIVNGQALIHVSVSLKHIAFGYFLACGVGLIIGTIMEEIPVTNFILMPLVDAIRPIAALSLFPLIILVLGIGTASKVAVIFWTSWPAIVLNTFQGLKTVDHEPVEAAQLDGANKFQILHSIKFPLSTGTVMTGLRIGLSGGWISLVAAEMLGSSSGLGYAVLDYSQTFRFPEMYAIIVLISLIGLLMNILLWQFQQFIQTKFLEDISNEKDVTTFSYGDRAVALIRLFTSNGRVGSNHATTTHRPTD